MHELSLLQNLMEQVGRLCQEHHVADSAVRSIRIGVGEMSGVESALLRSAYEMLAVTRQDCNADLQVEEIPLEASCRTCAQVFRVERFQFVCPFCASTDLRVLRGDAVILKTVVLEMEEEGKAH